MGHEQEVVSAEEFDAMTPQQRADAVRRSVIHTWDDVEPSFRERVEARAGELAKRSQQDA